MPDNLFIGHNDGVKMIVIYNQPNIFHLPYYTIKKVQKKDKNNIPIIDEKTGEQKLISKKVTEYHTFIPGKNIISREKWLDIVEYNKNDMEYYEPILKPFKPIVDKETQIEIGTDEINIDYKKLKTNEMLNIVENTFDKKELEIYLKNEKKRDNPRIAIKKAIKSQMIIVSEAEEALEKD